MRCPKCDDSRSHPTGCASPDRWCRGCGHYFDSPTPRGKAAQAIVGNVRAVDFWAAQERDAMVKSTNAWLRANREAIARRKLLAEYQRLAAAVPAPIPCTPEPPRPAWDAKGCGAWSPPWEDAL